MSLYSRHSGDGRARLGDIHNEEEYDQFTKMIFISSNFTDEIQSHKSRLCFFCNRSLKVSSFETMRM